jgi:hypothetical protein
MYQGLDTQAMEDLAARAATSVCKRIPGSSWEDLKQDGIVWMLAHEHKLIEWASDEDQGYFKTYRNVYQEVVRLAAKDKAARTGYHHTDNFYYSLPMLRRMLPLFYMDKLASLIPSLTDELDLPDRDAYLDIESGLRKIPLAVRQTLFAWYGEDRDQTEVISELADFHDISYEAAAKRHMRTLKKLQEAIGGPAPSTHVGRKAISNAAARAAVSNAYDEGSG